MTQEKGQLKKGGKNHEKETARYSFKNKKYI